MEKYLSLRSAHPVFTYRSYSITETETTVEASWSFSIDGLAEFAPSWSFPKPEGFTSAGDQTLERLVFSLGMAEAISYWKAACCPTVRVLCGQLSPEQILWWKKLWFMCLG